MLLASSLLLIMAGLGCGQDALAPDVGLPGLASLHIEPPALRLAEGESGTFSVTLLDEQGRPMGGAAGVTWSSSDASVVRTDDQGRVDAVSPGSAVISARKDGTEASASVTVRGRVDELEFAAPPQPLAVGESVQVDVTILDEDGNPIGPRWLTWTTSDVSVAEVDSAGVVTAHGPGAAVIAARIDGLADSVSVEVEGEGSEPADVATVSVSPASASVQVGASLQLSVTLQDGSGQVLEGREVSWSTSDETVAPVDGSGLVGGVSAGSVTITATSGGQSGSASIQVVSPAPVPVATVAVTPASATVEEGGSLSLTATVQDSAGNVLTGRDVDWASSDAGVATVDGSGTVSAVSAGSAIVTATSEGVSGSATIAVKTPPPPSSSPPPVATITIAPSTASLETGKTLQLSATLQDSSGNVLTGRDVSWSSGKRSVATVSGTGLVTAVAAGSATIAASSEGESATATITVSSPPPPPVATVDVSPAAVTVQVGASAQLSVALQDADGNVLTGRDVSWSSSDGSVVTVDGSGRVTAVAQGTATVTATSEGESGSAAITVPAPAPPPVATVTVSPSSASVAAGASVQLSATLKDASGGTLTGRAVAWSSSTPSVATIDGSGKVTGVSAGSATVTATSEGKSGDATITVPAPPPPSGSRGGFYVSPSGSSTGNGSASRPWDLSTALSHPGSVQPGDTIWLRGGTYRGNVTSHLRGLAGRPIVVRGYPGERATVDGRLEIRGTHGVYWGFEVMNSHTKRWTNQTGSWPTDVPKRQTSVALRNQNNKVVNMVIHDLGGGLSVQSNSAGHEIYGNLIYNNGWDAPDRGHGHGIYVQEAGRIEDNIVFQNFGMGINVFGKGVTARGIDVIGNISFNSGVHATGGQRDLLAWGTSDGLSGITVRDNMLYRSDRWLTLDLGNAHGPSERDIDVTGNYAVGLIWIADWLDFVFERNTVVGGDDKLLQITPDQTTTAGYRLDRNTYYRKPGAQPPFLWVGGGAADLAAWQQRYGFDTGSSLTIGEPSGTRVFVRPNRWERGRANVAVYNWAGASSASVDLSSSLRPGDAYEVRDAQDFYGPPVASGVYHGGSVQVPLRSTSPALPIGGSRKPVPSTGPEFHVFVVLPAGS